MAALLLTILFGTLIIIAFKVISILKLDLNQIITFNYFVAAGFGFLMWDAPLDFGLWQSMPWFELSIIIGVFFILTYKLFGLSSDKAGLAITAVASKMSVVIPVLAGFILFHDHLSVLKVVGILLVLLSFYFIFKPEKGLKINRQFILLPLLLLLGNGINDSMVKYTQHFYINHDEGLFLSFIFLVALGIGLIYLFFSQFIKGKFFTLKSLLGGLILGSLNYWGAWFFLKSMAAFQASFLFPVVNVGIVSLSALISFIIFRENLSKTNWLGILLAIVAIMLVSLG
ncbi:MAG: EamA family transporter [Bacteroidetes bacterium]|nr:EamA family transporter [Bacteroidota bacterium]